MTVKHSTKVLLAVLCTALFVTACAGDPNRKTKIGAGVGAVLGGLTGSQLGDESGTNVASGAALGVVASTVLRRMSLPAMVALGVGGYAAKKFFDFKTVIPCHYKTFPLLEQSADALVAALPGVDVRTPEVMETIEI